MELNFWRGKLAVRRRDTRVDAEPLNRKSVTKRKGGDSDITAKLCS